MIPRTYAQAKAEKQKSAARKISRAAKRKELWAGKPGFDKRGKPWTVGKIKKRIVRLLGLRDKKINGPFCRYKWWCPKMATRRAAFGRHSLPSRSTVRGSCGFARP